MPHRRLFRSLVRWGERASSCAVQDRVFGERDLEIPVVSPSGLGTAHASIKVAPLTDELKSSWCKEQYGDDKWMVQGCVDDEKGWTAQTQITANCASGDFTTLDGLKLRFMGKAEPEFQDHFDYVLESPDRQILNGSMASGYYEAMSQSEAMCPGCVEKAPIAYVFYSCDSPELKSQTEQTVAQGGVDEGSGITVVRWGTAEASRTPDTPTERTCFANVLANNGRVYVLKYTQFVVNGQRKIETEAVMRN